MSDTIKKVYRIKITGANGRPNIWYATKKGKEFEAELKGTDPKRPPVFYVNPCSFVHLIDCEVVAERNVDIYFKKEQ
jgi:hypothetical protein